jgi:hypothetical protein
MTALTAENVREVRQRGFTVVSGALDVELAGQSTAPRRDRTNCC